MLARINGFMRKYKQPILYILFGVFTTIVNIVVYCVLTDALAVHYLVSNVMAWIVSVMFAFVTNKLWVFESQTWIGMSALIEMANFFLSRVATGVMDMLFMWVLVDVIVVDEMVAKVSVNILVIIANYLASKLWIFRRDV